jgi:hypothetical protein
MDANFASELVAIEAFRYAQRSVVGTRDRRGVADREHAHEPREPAVATSENRQR